MESGKEAEHELITASLELERLEKNLFRSKSLWLPSRARGVFGGQVISQALLAATNCVDPVYAVHSLHCYFLLSANAAIPIVYYVEILREGRSYTTCIVKAVQNGKCVFVMTSSFHRPEANQPSHQWTMPKGVPPPDECPLQEEVYEELAKTKGISAEAKERILLYAQDRRHSPIAMKAARRPTSPGGYDEREPTMYWLKARGVTFQEPSFHKCILAYLSDLNYIGTAGKALNLSNVAKPPNRLAMMSSLDHTIWFYDHDFDCSEWVLHVMECPVGGSGRGLVHGRVYTQSGRLIAATTQEGVVRADRGDLINKAGRAKM